MRGGQILGSATSTAADGGDASAQQRARESRLAALERRGASTQARRSDVGARVGPVAFTDGSEGLVAVGVTRWWPSGLCDRRKFIPKSVGRMLVRMHGRVRECFAMHRVYLGVRTV